MMLTEAGPCSRVRMPGEGRAAAAARISCWQISASAWAARRGQAARMSRKSAYGLLAARTARGSGTSWSASRSRSRPVTGDGPDGQVADRAAEMQQQVLAVSQGILQDVKAAS